MLSRKSRKTARRLQMNRSMFIHFRVSISKVDVPVNGKILRRRTRLTSAPERPYSVIDGQHALERNRMCVDARSTTTVRRSGGTYGTLVVFVKLNTSD